MGLPCGEEIMIVGWTMWTQCTSVTDRQTDGQTDGRTDRITMTKAVQRRAVIKALTERRPPRMKRTVSSSYWTMNLWLATFWLSSQLIYRDHTLVYSVYSACVTACYVCRGRVFGRCNFWKLFHSVLVTTCLTCDEMFDYRFLAKTKTATCSCLTRKRAFHLYSPGVVRRSHAAAR